MLGRMPRAIWALGLVSLFMDVSSEMIHGLLPIFVVGTLGASAFALGIMEGIAEAIASALKLPSGWLSDRLGARKPIAIAGYGLSAAVKPIFALAPSLGWVLSARFLDRIGKGIRGAPRDALVADLTPLRLRGAAFGLRQSLDTLGAFAGPLIAVVAMAWSGNDIRLVFWLATPPALISVLLLCILVPEAGEGEAVRDPSPPPAPAGGLRAMGAAFWTAIFITGVFFLGRYSEAFLILRAQERGLPLALAPLVLVAMNLVYSLAAYPAGRWSDRIGRRGLLLIGALAMAARRCASGGRAGPRRVGRRGRVVGVAHGVQPGRADRADRRCGAAGAQGHGLRGLPPDRRDRRLRGQRGLRLSLGQVRSCFGLPCGAGRGAPRRGGDRIARRWPASDPDGTMSWGNGCILAATACLCTASVPAQAQSWDDILRQAKGQEVYWNAWAGDPAVNDYIAWVAGEVRRRFDIHLVHVKIADTAEAVSRVLAEAAAGRNRAARSTSSGSTARTSWR